VCSFHRVRELHIFISDHFHSLCKSSPQLVVFSGQVFMPELPEVETVVRGLRISLPGRTIDDVRFGKTDFVDDPRLISERLPGLKISGVTRHGKFICIQLEPKSASENSRGRHCLIVHLGMTGQLTVADPSDPVKSHTHVFFALNDGRELRYRDVRRFGRMLTLPRSELADFQKLLGKEPLEVSEEEFCQDIGARRTRLKALLLDQTVLCGIGNIYADESLFRAGLHPVRTAEKLKKEQLLALRVGVREVLEEAIQSRGSSISDYRDSEGKSGTFQLQHRVYQRNGEPCLQCKSIIRRIIVAGRSTHFCPVCQPAARTRNASKKKLRTHVKSRVRKSDRKKSR
jgi:formamidopyrimidine-DNA glycosylase